jgi:hypothetical protein
VLIESKVLFEAEVSRGRCHIHGSLNGQVVGGHPVVPDYVGSVILAGLILGIDSSVGVSASISPIVGK